MCGIAGIVVTPGELAPSRELGERMIESIRHRGPDDAGVHQDERAMLGMRRLSIIDVDGGHQPMYTAEGAVCIVYNGEIYNYRELREALLAHGHTFVTHSDTEVILQAYLRYGNHVFEKLDGMFAIAIWDRRSGVLYLARDKFGEKPLYYCNDGKRLIFGSELKCLLEDPACTRDIDSDALRAYFTFGYVPAPMSIFSGIRKLPPAHYLEYVNGQHRLHRYWTPPTAPVTSTLREGEAEEELAVLLKKAVASRLVSDVPFGAFLSGGLDSSTIVALMCRETTHRVKTFTIGFSEGGYNELDDARRAAAYLGTEHHELVVEPDAVGLLEKLVWHFDEPFADASAVPTYLVSELARQHVKMVLTGDGGDELFGGYDRYLRLRKLERLGALRRPMASMMRLVGPAIPDPLGNRVSRVAERLALPFMERYLSGVALMRPDTASTLSGHAANPGHYDLPMVNELAVKSATASALDRAVSIDLHSYLPDDILVKLDRMAMANSLEGRSPFLHPELAEFALRLPEHMRIRHGRGKYLLRKVASQWLPSEVLSKPKQGFALPLPVWFRGPLKPLAADTFASMAFRQRGMVSAKAASQLLSDHVHGKADHSEALWQLLCLELWSQRFLAPTRGAH